MAELALAIASSHAPGLTGWLDSASESSQDLVKKGFAHLEQAIDQAGVDVLVVIANDHIANARVNDYPDFTIAMAERHEGPDDWFKDWLKVDDYSIAGDPDFANTMFKELSSRGFGVYAADQNLRYDDNLSVPVSLTRIVEKGIRVIPILQNCTVPPIPDHEHCYRFGLALREIIDEAPDDLRVGLYATGGMSHEPGGPRYFLIDEEFDRAFLELLEEGDHERLRDEATLEAMESAGTGGTAELLSWLIVAAAVGDEVPCRPVFYDPMKQMRCGIGGVHWQLDAGERNDVA